MSSLSPDPRPSFGKRLLLAVKNIILFVLKLVLTLIVLGAIGAAIYFGVPVLVEEYLLQDVRTNQAAIAALENDLSQNTSLTNEQLEALQTRVETLESQNDAQKQTIADLNAQIVAAQEDITAQTGDLEALAAEMTALDEYEARLHEFEREMAEQSKTQTDLQTALNTLQETQNENQASITALQTALENQDSFTALSQQFELLKVMELITRARVSLGQENFGLARTDLALAGTILTDLSSEVTPNQAVYLADIILRVELAAKNINGAAVMVEKDLEVAWQALVSGLPEADESATDEAEETAVPTETPTPTPNP